MASLVANYGSDEDSEPDSDHDKDTTPVQPEETGVNYLIPEEGGDSDSDADADQEKDASDKLPNPMAEKLPAPKLRKIKKKDKSVQRTAASIFTNQYEKAEMAKQSLLEKHVKMTEGVNPSGRKICRKFKLGKCRFGKSCKYSHDLDTNLSLRYTQEDPSTTEDDSNEMQRRKNYPQLPPPPKPQGFMGTLNSLKASSGPKYSHQQMRHFREQERQMHTQDDDESDDRGIADDKRKRRIGVSQSLVPPKKAMSNLTKQRMEERPWTYKNN